MSISKMIYEDVKELKENEGTKDPLDILISRGVKVLTFNDDTNMLGMYTDVLGKKFVFYNKRLDEPTKRMVLAHELGHNIYHTDYKDIATFESMSQKKNEELEANIFAAHLLIEDDDVLELLERDYGIGEISQSLYVTPDLCVIKLNEMKKLGFPISQVYSFDANFFKNIKGMDKNVWDDSYIMDDASEYGC